MGGFQGASVIACKKFLVPLDQAAAAFADLADTIAAQFARRSGQVEGAALERGGGR